MRGSVTVHRKPFLPSVPPPGLVGVHAQAAAQGEVGSDRGTARPAAEGSATVGRSRGADAHLLGQVGQHAADLAERQAVHDAEHAAVASALRPRVARAAGPPPAAAPDARLSRLRQRRAVAAVGVEASDDADGGDAVVDEPLVPPEA